MHEGGEPKSGLVDGARSDVERTLPPQTKGRLKKIGIVLGGALTALTAGSAHFQPETLAERTAGATSEALEALAEDLEATELHCEQVAAAGAAEARAEADAVRTLVLGYLLAQGRGGKASPKRVQETLEEVMEDLGEHKAATELVPLIPSQAAQKAPPLPAPPPAAKAPKRMKEATQKLKQYSAGEF